MTTYSERTVKCRLCNHSQTVYLLGSCSSFGAPDLDTRPAEMARGAIMSILQVCPECGYAAFDISDDVKKPQAVKKLLASFPKSETLSDDYYKAGEIARQISNDHGDAFVYYLRAAWSADDENNAQKAKEMRSLALKEKKFLLQSAESPAVEDFLQASDIARRAEKFDAAADLIASLDGKEMEPFIRKLVSYEKKLIVRKDTACHSVSEIERKKPRNDTLPQSPNTGRHTLNTTTKEAIERALKEIKSNSGEAFPDIIGWNVDDVVAAAGYRIKDFDEDERDDADVAARDYVRELERHYLFEIATKAFRVAGIEKDECPDGDVAGGWANARHLSDYASRAELEKELPDLIELRRIMPSFPDVPE